MPRVRLDIGGRPARARRVPRGPGRAERRDRGTPDEAARTGDQDATHARRLRATVPCTPHGRSLGAVPAALCLLAVRAQLRTLLGQTAIYGLGGGAAQAIGVLTLPVFARALDQAEYGTLELYTVRSPC